jgi:hypothetical protein
MFVSGASATVARYHDVGELIVPGAGNAPDSLRLAPGMWAGDNGIFNAPPGPFDAGAFMWMLQRFHGRKGCRFIAAPDAVADAHKTLEQWPFWSGVIRGAGFVPALVLQNGMLASEVPWREVGAVFVGGTTEWKLGPQARDLMAYAKTRGLWVHVGRVNSAIRVQAVYEMGADSFDGTGFSIAPDINIPKGLAWAGRAMAQGSLL